MIHFKRVRNSCHYIVLLFLALNLVSCFPEIPCPPDRPPVGSGKSVVYVSGTGMNQDGTTAATYWNNGVPTILTATLPNAAVYNSSGFGMTVSGSDVYVCGVLFTTQGSLPVYWKNGVPVVLSQDYGQATAIAVVNSDVYVAGIVSDNGYSRGVLWKNGVISNLTEGAIYSSASALLVSGADVYVGGYLFVDNKTYATYWKNGTPHILTSGDTWGNIQTLALVGGNLYAAGQELGSPVGKYWKNDQPVNLTDGSGVTATAVYVNGNDVYVAGKKQSGAWQVVVWKNNAIVSTTPINGIDFELGQIAVAQNNVVVTGSIVYANANSSIYADATIWTNGAPSTLTKGSDGVNVYGANSIVVK